MKRQAKAVLKTLFTQSGHGEELLHFLPESLAEEIKEFPGQEPCAVTRLISSAHWGEKIHFSWFSDLFKDLPEKVQALCLDTLTTDQKKGLEKMLSLSVTPTPTGPFVRPFVKHYLRQQLQEDDLVTKEVLPSSPFNSLLKLKTTQLIHIIDLLGIHDLAADLRQIVDKILLGKIYQALSREQLQFLHYCSKQPMKWISPKLGLLAWDGSKKQLNHLLHHRGLIRLARGIAQEDSSYKWHLLHRLDIGRAKIIQKEFYQKQDLNLLPYFKNQVLHIAKRYL